MSIVDCHASVAGNPSTLKLASTQRPLHRLAAVRQLQGLSCRTVARRLNMETAQLKLEERETSDMLLSHLYEWQEALEVPLSELLIEPGDPLSPPVLERAGLVRIMKTVQTILEETQETPIRRMAQTLVDQLLEIMPELEGLGAWHAVGRRRRRDELGVAAQRRLSDDVFVDRSE